MTDKEIIKALECCADLFDCISCPCKDFCGDLGKLQQNALDLINRQQAEIEYLQGEREVLLEDIHHSADQINEQFEEIERLQKENNQFADIGKMYSEIRAEAIKEFAENIKLEFYKEFDEIIPSIMADKIDNLVKEMVGEQE